MGPHIISILADDAGWNDFGFTRGILAPSAELVGPQAMTPNIDALAAGGITELNSAMPAPPPIRIRWQQCTQHAPR